MEEDEMDSLFEGMELITPSQLATTTTTDGHHNHPPPPAAVVVEVNGTTAGSSSHTQQVSQPLDENLFSDLTLVSPPPPRTPTPDSTPTTSQPTSAFSRQISRKKKRAAGLRIGYGRDYSSFDIDPPSPHPLPAEHLKGGADGDDDDAEEDATATATADAPPLDAQLKSQGDSPQLELERIKSLISIKLKHAGELAASISSARKESIRSRRKAAERLDLVSAKHGDLEQQLEAACEAEDFETADRISQSLAAAEDERQSLLNALKDAQLHCDAIDFKMHDALDSQIATEQECASLLLHFARDAETNAGLSLDNAQAHTAQAMDNWFSSTESLEAKRIQFDIESVFMNEARLTVKDSIEHFIHDDVREREILCKERDMLSDELHKLLALVKQKEKEIADSDDKIKAVEERIAGAASGFHDIESTIVARYDNLQAGLSEINLQNEALSTKRKEIDDFLTEERMRGSKLREMSKISEDEAKSYQQAVELRKTLKLSILKSREENERLAKAEEKFNKDIQKLQEEASAARASLQELVSTKASVQQDISTFKQKISFIDKRIPELEAEKRVSATARNFKEAARIAAEAKSLSIEKDNMQVDLEKATSQLEKLEEDINNIFSTLKDTEELISSKKKEAATARYQRLLLIAGAATAERYAALELGDTEEASLLLAEAEAARTEAKNLEPIYNLKEEEFANLPKHFISMELVSKLGNTQLAELAASIDVSAVESSEP